MTRWIAVIIGACVLLSGKAALAHRIDEYLQATILSLETNRVEASMRLVPGILVSNALIASIDSNSDGVFSESEERAYAERVLSDLTITFEGKSVQPKLGWWSFPQPAQMRDGVGEIHIAYTADLQSGRRNRRLMLANHHLSRTSVYLMNVLAPVSRDVRIVAQKRNELQSLYELDYEQIAASEDQSLWRWADVHVFLNGIQFSSFFQLSIRHIADGTDHLLFLLVLLLPAPLVVSGLRWGQPIGATESLIRILGIVTAFTIGHSITLTIAALGAVKVPSRPVEVLIALSIFVSALHAFRPIFPGREALIAAFFGLIHGLGFAATLDRLGFGRWERVAGIFSFNLGIETMQMVVVAAVLPSLILMSRTPLYSILRNGGAAFAGAASLGWMTERLLKIETPVDTVVKACARHAPAVAVILFLVSVASRILVTSPAKRTINMAWEERCPAPVHVETAPSLKLP